MKTFLGDIQLWEQQSGETTRQYELFLAYRDLGPGRTFVRAERQVLMRMGKISAGKEKSVCSTYVLGWAQKNQWRERAQAYDLFMERQQIQARVEDIREALRRHVTQARGLQTEAIRRMTVLRREYEDIGIPLSELRGLAEVFDRGIRMERLSLGIAETVAEERTMEVSRSPLEERLLELGNLYDSEEDPDLASVLEDEE